jgi:hypothetical protein
MKHALLLLALGCTILARDMDWELMRCDDGNTRCYLHHQILPTEDKWLMDCLVDKDAKWSGIKTTLPTTFHGR